MSPVRPLLCAFSSSTITFTSSISSRSSSFSRRSRSFASRVLRHSSGNSGCPFSDEVRRRAASSLFLYCSSLPSRTSSCCR